jgi:hypothetical protein
VLTGLTDVAILDRLFRDLAPVLGLDVPEEIHFDLSFDNGQRSTRKRHRRGRAAGTLWGALTSLEDSRIAGKRGRRLERLASMSLALVTSWLLLWGVVAIYGTFANLRAS